MKRLNIFLTVVFAVIVVVELAGRLTDNIVMEYSAKPLIMIWIAIYFLRNARKRELVRPVLLAFLFSWIGDMLLMFSGGYGNEMLFYAGVGGFLVAQLFYIFTFLRSGENEEKGLIRRSPLWALPLAAYLVGIFLLLLPGLEGIMIPVILVYAIALVGMSVTALNRYGKVNRISFWLVFVGSLFFVSSDSMIAINKFHSEFALAGFWIMLTYIIAQYLIMLGLTREIAKK